MKIDKKSALVSIVPFLFFLAAIVYLFYSHLTLEKIIEIQDKGPTMFFRLLIENNLVSSLESIFSYLWSNGISTAVVFLLLISMGLFFEHCFREKMDRKIHVLLNFLLMASVLLVLKSLIIFLITLALFVGYLTKLKKMKINERGFSTGYSYLSSQLRLISIFIVVGLLITMLGNSEYQQQFYNSTLNAAINLLPNSDEIKDAQKSQIKEISEGFKSSLEQQYQTLDENVKTECKPMYDAMIAGMDEFEKQSTHQIDEQEIDVTQELASIGSMFEIIAKTMPFFVALGVYFTLGIINFLLSVSFGFVYFLLNLPKPKKKEESPPG